MDDRTLLEKAAKAAGIDAEWHNDDEADFDAAHEGMFLKGQCSPDNDKYWNPLRCDGDALRLAVKLRFDIDHHEDSVNVWDSYFGTGFIPNGDDPYAATRRAIVRAAASLADADDAARAKGEL